MPSLNPSTGREQFSDRQEKKKNMGTRVIGVEKGLEKEKARHGGQTVEESSPLKNPHASKKRHILGASKPANLGE